MFVEGGIFIEIGQGEFEQGGGGLRVVSLQVHKRAGQLDQPFEKIAVRATAVAEPEVLQHFMGLIKKLMIETVEIAEIMRVQFLTVMPGSHPGNAFALAAHRAKVKSRAQSLKPKVAPATEPGPLVS